MPGATPERLYPYPLYTDPQDFPSDIQDLALAVDADVQSLDAAMQAGYNRDSVRVVGPVGGTQLIPTGVQTNVTYTAEEYDNAGMANLGVTNDRITVVNSGAYLITGHVTLAAGPSATWGASLQMNTTGASVGQPVGVSRLGHNTRPTNLTVTSVHLGAVASTVRLSILHNAGSNLTVTRCSLTATLMT